MAPPLGLPQLEGDEHGPFLSLLHALAGEYAVVAAERDRLKAISMNLETLGRSTLPQPDEVPQEPQVFTSRVASKSKSKESSALRRDDTFAGFQFRAPPSGFGSEESDSDDATRHRATGTLTIPPAPLRYSAIVKLSIPDALRQRMSMATGEANFHPPKLLQPRTHGTVRRLGSLNGATVFVLDRRWRDLYYACEHEAEVEAGATLTFRKEALAASPDGRTSKVLTEGYVSTASGPGMSVAVSINASTTSAFKEDSAERKSFFKTCMLIAPIRPTDLFPNLWDFVGILLILYDAIALPISVAWDFDPPELIGFFLICYWLFDVIIKFNLGYYAVDGTLITGRWEVTKAYLRTWFVFDIIVLTIDIVMVSLPSIADMRAVRAVRAVRLIRLLRLIKANRIMSGFEDIMADFGVQRLFLFWGVFETICSILLLSHFLACTWYYLGWISWNDGLESWLAILDDPEPTEVSEYYSKSLYWVLGHLVAAPVDTTVAPQNRTERGFTIGLICGSLLVVGAGISKMTNAIAEIHRSAAEATDTSWQLRQKLKGHDRAVISRVVRFALHSMRRRNDQSTGQGVLSLLSKNLATELFVRQRSRAFNSHGLFEMIKVNYPEVFVQLCTAFSMNIYADNEIVFGTDTISECLYCTLSGIYHYSVDSVEVQSSVLAWASASKNNLQYSSDGTTFSLMFDRPTFLCELSLYCTKIHQGELRTGTFADVLVLSGANFSSCVRLSPKCVGLAYRYAHELFRVLSQPGEVATFELIDLSTVSMICERLAQLTSPSEAELDSPPVSRFEVKDFLAEVRSATDDEFYAGTSSLVDELPRIFPELDSCEGIYAKLGEDAERLRVISSMCSFIWLLRGDHDRFTAAQPPNRRMTLEQWEELREFWRWTDLSESEVHAMLVLLVVRGLGKVKAFLQAMPFEDRTPEAVTQELLHIMPEQVPSKCVLHERHISLIDKCLEVHQAFNLAQLLQGENTPRQVVMLLELASTHGPRVFRFSLFAFVALMFGIRGAESPHGSLIMDRGMTSSVLTACGALMQLGKADPVAIYWSYITDRAARMGLPTRWEEDLVLCRLACLIRASGQEVKELKHAWESLHWHERKALADHFLADGISETVFVFTYLPAFFASARANPLVGLRRAFVVLIDLLELLEAGAYADAMDMVSINLNLQDLGPFTKEAQNTSAFLAVMDHSTLEQRGQELVLQISTQHKENAAEAQWSRDTAMQTRAAVRYIARTLSSATDSTLGARRPQDEVADPSPLFGCSRSYV